MLVSFSVENYRSFKGPNEITLVKASSKTKGATSAQPGLSTRYDYSLLNCVAVYGANASGKSNLFKAIQFMRDFVVDFSSKRNHAEPFLLDDYSSKSPSKFSIEFIIKEIYYEYTFTVKKRTVLEESLYYTPNSRKTLIFKRKGDKIEGTKKMLPSLKSYKGLTRPDVLFLSVLNQFNHELGMDIVAWFESLKMIDGTLGGQLTSTALSAVKRPELLNIIENFMSAMDISINRIEIEETNDSDALASFSERHMSTLPDQFGLHFFDIKFYRYIFNNEKVNVGELGLNFSNQESEGTKRLFSMAGPIINALLEGSIIVVDELDSKLHSSLTSALIDLFTSPEINTTGAQLIFTTHDTALLGEGVELYRDQIWFTEKSYFGGSKLVALYDYKGLRSKLSYQELYLDGRFGAVPLINTLGLGAFSGLLDKERSCIKDKINDQDSK